MASGDILKKLRKVYGDGALEATVVNKWIACYKKGRELLEDGPHAGKPALTNYLPQIDESRIVTLQKHSGLIEKQYN